MRKPTEIVDFLLDQVDGLERRDLEARIKVLRAAGFFPPAKRVGDRPAEGVTARHCANLLIAILGSNTAVGAAESVQALADLPLMYKARSDDVGLLVMPKSFVDFLERSIRQWREGARPWKESLNIGEIQIWHGVPWRALVVFDEIEPSEDGQFDLRLAFASEEQEQQPPRFRITEHRSVHGHIIDVMALWLLGDEEEDEEEKGRAELEDEVA
jgi:hypothetical protein